jgi:flagellar biosynthesis protein FlhA
MASVEKTFLGKILQRTDILMPIGVAGILVIMILPIPALLLDLFLTVSISFAVIILLVSLYVQEPLDFSTFPSVLLIATLFRLSLNIATTRRILLHGNEGVDAAGAVIESFGQFVVGGNFVVGFIIFLILVIINFVVITKGSGRVAEVAARFTLDAMPGKQMSIDADLNAGIIDELEAKKQRENIQSKADFYGAMDGASKFVRGDAIAGLIITAINILGGLIIGVTQYNMDFAESAQVFTILTVGDGLVTQIPAIVVSTAAGIVVTRAGEESDLGTKLFDQMFSSSRVLGLAGFMLVFFGLIPGLPKLSFFFLGGILIALSFTVTRKIKSSKDIQEAEDEEPSEETSEEDDVKDLLDMDLMELEIGFNLISLVDESQGGTLLSRIKSIRRQIAMEMGFIVPPVRIRDNLQVGSNSYSIIIKGVKVADGEVFPDKFMVMNPDGEIEGISGTPTKEPAFGLPALWVDGADKETAEMEGYTIVDPSTVIATHLTEVIKANAHELLGRQETQELLDQLKNKYPKLVEDVVPNVLDLGLLQRILQELLKERVSIRNLQTILEILAAYGTQNKNIDYLLEKVRSGLKRQISSSLQANDGTLYVFTLNSKIEQMVANNIQTTDDGKEIVLDPAVGQKMLSALSEKVNEILQKGLTPVLVISPPIRLAFRRFVEKFISNLHIISHNEISENTKIESLGTLEIDV